MHWLLFSTLCGLYWHCVGGLCTKVYRWSHLERSKFSSLYLKILSDKRFCALYSRHFLLKLGLWLIYSIPKSHFPPWNSPLAEYLFPSHESLSKLGAYLSQKSRQQVCRLRSPQMGGQDTFNGSSFVSFAILTLVFFLLSILDSEVSRCANRESYKASLKSAARESKGPALLARASVKIEAFLVQVGMAWINTRCVVVVK